MKICLIQSSSEIDLIRNKLGFTPIIIPLSLESLVYCDLNRIEYLDPESIIEKDFYKKASYSCSESLTKINLDKFKFDFLKNEIRSIIRFRFNQIVFLIEIIENLKKKKKISEIFFTNKYSSIEYDVMTIYPGYNFANIESVLLNLYNDSKIKLLEIFPKKNLNEIRRSFKYRITGLRYKKKNKIFFNNSGYNFRRLILYFLKKRSKISILNEGIPIYKKILFKLIGIEIIDFKKIKNLDKNNNLDFNCSFNFKNFDISDIIKLQITKSSYYLLDLKNKYYAMYDFFNSSKIDLVISNSNRGIGGIVIENASRKRIKSLMVSHGTIAKGFGIDDGIYKKIIAEGVFSGKANFHAIQSKITRDSLKTHKLIGKPLITGNLVFAEKNKFLRKKKFICLYAVTNKPFAAMQLFGLEMYHEFFNNLKSLEKLSKEENYNFLVHLHPGAKNSILLLKKRFKYLKFTTGRIEKSLKNASVTLSYSSTVIEDSLHCNVPVILLDTRSRYKHCESEHNPDIKNKSIYYINNITNLKKCIETIKESKNIKFSDNIFLNDSKENIKKLFSTLIK